MIYKRKPPPGNVRRARHIGKTLHGVTTNKRGRLVQFESEQERKLILLLERDATVFDFISQPETLIYVSENGRFRRYTPDFQVWRSNGQIELHEVTVSHRRQTKETIQQREIAAQEICRQRGWTYYVHTEQTLPTGYEYANLDALSPFRSETYADGEIILWWLTHLHERGQVQPQCIFTNEVVTYHSGRLLNTLYHLLWHDQVQMNWDAPFIWRGVFHPDARIWLKLETPQMPSFIPLIQEER